ncbi:MAG: CvpA family protein [Gammaproteobacteria bacterium]
MNWVDIVIIAIVSVSALISLFRGFVKEALSLASWVISFGLAVLFADNVAGMLDSWIDSPLGRWAAAFILILVIALAIGTILNHIAGLAIEKAGLTTADRALGAIFGMLRGVMIVLTILVVANFVGNWLDAPLASLWKDSIIVGWLKPVANLIAGLLPDKFANVVTF